ncbi:hypothetical protein [Streptosporangium jomthongense]|uniref:RES domain-containing protein n=1 Tax=Streptosporangium jomthongense TaxID=1193683 RepID=A0ABV8ETI6_9ACTN
MHERTALISASQPHQPWCNNHYTDPRHAEDSYCRRGSGTGLYLSDTDDGPRLFAHDATADLDQLPLDQVEARLRAGLELVTAYRTAVAA